MPRHTDAADDIRIERIDTGRWLLSARQRIPRARERVFPFFADAANLGRITPPSMGFDILTPGPIAMRAGTLIDYRIRVLGIPLRWRTLISRWDPPHAFADEQLRGPYAEWHHLHRFTPIGENTTLMEDEVRFRLPFGFVGALGVPFVKRQLRGIFAYRRGVIERLVLTGGW